MGDFEVFLATISVSILAALVYNVITILSFKDLLRRLGFMKNTRRDFYECGFKPQNQRPVKISLQFFTYMCVFPLVWYWTCIFISLCLGLYLYGFVWFIIISVIFWCTVHEFKYRLRATCVILTGVEY